MNILIRTVTASLPFLTMVLLLSTGGGSSVSSAHPGFSVSMSATPSSGSAPLFVSFSATVLSGVPTEYNWSFGDGAFYNGSASPQNSSPTHEYVVPGRYAVTVKVWEGGASSEGGPVIVTVGHASIVLEASATPTAGYAPLTVVFNVTATGGTGTYTSFVWHFGDGGTGSGAVVGHDYSTPGNYHATITVMDSSGTQATSELNVTVDRLKDTGGAGSSSPWEWAAAGFAGGVLVALGAIFFLRRREARPHEPSLSEPVPPEAPHPEETPAPGAFSSRTGEIPPLTESSSPEASPPAMPVITLSHRVVVHLSQQGIVSPSELTPPALTQGGIARVLGVKQNVLTNVLRRLEESGVVVSSVTHVRGELRRLKSYRLTTQGEALARELRGRKL